MAACSHCAARVDAGMEAGHETRICTACVLSGRWMGSLLFRIVWAVVGLCVSVGLWGRWGTCEGVGGLVGGGQCVGLGRG